MLECFGTEDFDLIDLANQEAIKLRQTKSKSSFEIFVAHVDLEIVLELLSINIKAPLVGFINDSVSHLRAKHHLIASHVVIHHILQHGHERVFINEIKVNELVRGNLDPDVSFDVENEAASFYCVNTFPALHFCEGVDDLSEEIDVA